MKMGMGLQSRWNKIGLAPGCSDPNDPPPLSCPLGYGARRVVLVLKMHGNIGKIQDLRTLCLQILSSKHCKFNVKLGMRGGTDL
jgi:hypothetical protein